MHVPVQMYLYVGNWKFKVMERKEVERQAVALRMTALDGNRKSQERKPQNGASHHDESTLHDLENGAHQALDNTKAWLLSLKGPMCGNSLCQADLLPLMEELCLVRLVDR